MNDQRMERLFHQLQQGVIPRDSDLAELHAFLTTMMVYLKTTGASRAMECYVRSQIDFLERTGRLAKR